MSSTDVLPNLIAQGRGGSADSEGSPMNNSDHHRQRALPTTAADCGDAGGAEDCRACLPPYAKRETFELNLA